jgi:hypothetical protein
VFARYTVREFEEAVAGAQMRHTLLADVMMVHALQTGQWSTKRTFRDLTGRDAPLDLDPRIADARIAAVDRETDDDRERRERNEALLAEHQARMNGDG